MAKYKEECDLNNLGDMTCTKYKPHLFRGGILRCNDDCTFNIDECLTIKDGCGDKVLDLSSEECDTDQFPVGKTCKSLGFGGGRLTCTPDCKIDTSSCDLCGNGQIDGEEECDRDNLPIKDCYEFAPERFARGELKCKTNCTYDTSECIPFKCGDGILQQEEECEENIFPKDKAICQDLGFDYGALKCSSECKIDTSGCKRCCGNGGIDIKTTLCPNSFEECDGVALGGKGCKDLGFVGGILKCTEACTYDKSLCHNCGNNSLDQGEECDGSEVLPEKDSCEKVKGAGFTGELKCSSDCKIDASNCIVPTCKNPVTDQAICGQYRCGIYYEDGTGQFMCLPNGTRDEGDPCEFLDYRDGKIDNCKKKLVCGGVTIGGESSQIIRQCTLFCDRDRLCPGIRKCHQNLLPGGFGFCDWCDVLIQSPCSNVEDACVLIPTGSGVWFGVCYKPGLLQEGEVCSSYYGQCAKGLGCLHISGEPSPLCYKYCDPQGGKPSCSSGYSCVTPQPFVQGVGICVRL